MFSNFSRGNETSTVEDITAAAHIPLAVYLSVVAILSLCCNTVLVYTIRTVRELHSAGNSFIVNLAIGNILTTLFTVPFDISLHIRGNFTHGVVLCGLSQVSFMTSLPASVINLSLLSVETIITIKLPFRGATYFTTKRMGAIITMSWMYSIVVGFYPILKNPRNSIVVDDNKCYMDITNDYILFQLLANFLFPSIVIITTNLWAFHIANRNADGLRRQNKPRAVDAIVENVKAARRVSLLIGIFIFCWLTFFIIILLNVLFSGNPLWTWIGNAMNYSGLFLNPIVYGLLNRKIRRAAGTRLHRALNYGRLEMSCSSTLPFTRGAARSFKSSIFNYFTAKNNNTEMKRADSIQNV